MLIEISDPSYQILWAVIPGVVVGLLTLLWIILGITRVMEWDSAGGAIFATILFGGLLTTMIAVGFGGGQYNEAVDDAKIAALRDAGFTNVNIDKDTFEGRAPDGSYFEGYLKPEGDLVWRVIDLSAEQ